MYIELIESNHITPSDTSTITSSKELTMSFSYSNHTNNTTQESEKKNISSYVSNHACFWLGLAAGTIRYLISNGIFQFSRDNRIEDNAQLFVDVSIESLMDRMVYSKFAICFMSSIHIVKCKERCF